MIAISQKLGQKSRNLHSQKGLIFNFTSTMTISEGSVFK